MNPYLKGTLATAFLGLAIMAVFAISTFSDSCMDVCMIDRTSTAIIAGAIGAAGGAFQGLVLTLLGAIGLCKRGLSYPVFSIVLLAGLGVMLAPPVGPMHEWAELEMLANVIVAVVAGLATGTAYAVGANGWRALTTW